MNMRHTRPHPTFGLSPWARKLESTTSPARQSAVFAAMAKKCATTEPPPLSRPTVLTPRLDGKTDSTVDAFVSTLLMGEPTPGVLVVPERVAHSIPAPDPNDDAMVEATQKVLNTIDAYTRWVQTGAHVPDEWTEEDARTFLAYVDATGMSMAEFSRTHSIERTRLSRWKRKLTKVAE